MNEQFNSLIENEIHNRKEEDEFYSKLQTENINVLKTRDELIQKYENLKGIKLKEYMLKVIYNFECDIKFNPCPSNYLENNVLYEEDKYNYIFGEETNKNIKDMCNLEMFKLATPENDDNLLTNGMIKYASGWKWNNGAIAYNKNSIVVRLQDNHYGQPGFLECIQFYDRLGIEIMKQYLVHELTIRVNNNQINKNSSSLMIKTQICEQYKQLRDKKINILDDPEITLKILFSDAPNINSIKNNNENSTDGQSNNNDIKNNTENSTDGQSNNDDDIKNNNENSTDGQSNNNNIIKENQARINDLEKAMNRLMILLENITDKLVNLETELQTMRNEFSTKIK